MGKGFKHGASGGDLMNFRILAYATEDAMKADRPANNTIGIVTQTAINGWCISGEAPASPAAGMVWIRTGTSGTAINVVRRMQILVVPEAAYQYSGGKWVSVTAKTYQSGWIQWAGDVVYLFKDGDQNADLTGGWKDIPTTSEKLGMYGTKSGVTEYVLFTQTLKLVDLKDYSKLIVTVEQYTPAFAVALIDASQQQAAAMEATATGQVTLDLTNLNSSYYIVLASRATGSGEDLATGFSVTEVRLER